MSGRLRHSVALAVMAAATAACGTTVPVAQQAGATQGLGVTRGEDSGAVEGTPLEGAQVEGALGTQPGGVGGSGSGALPAGSGGSTSGASTTGAAAVLPGTGPVEVGFFITKGVDKLFGTLGYSGLNPGDQERQVNAVVKAINATGGVAGRTIVPVFGIWDATAGNTVTQREAACAKWTQDHHVVMAAGESFDTFRGCSNKHRLPMLFSNPFPFTQEEMSAVPFMATPTVPLDERVHPAWVETLHAAGYFTPVTALPMKLGVVYADTPPQARSVKKNLEPALNRRGIKVTTWGAISTKSADALAASMQSTILRFRTDGVTHVMLVDTGGAGLLFMPQAESQGFRPRYGLHSWSKPAQIQGQVPAEQLRNAVGAGWNPTVDVDAAHRPRDNAAAKRCLDIMSAAGENPSASLARESAFGYCDMGFTLQAMANKARSLDAAKMIAALQTLGPEYQVAGSPVADFRGRKDAPAGMRTFRFVDSCSCFQYTSTPIRRF